MEINATTIPIEATRALAVIKELLDRTLIGVYLYGSAVVGGLRIISDVDILAVTTTRLSEHTSQELTDRLMQISGRPGTTDTMRPLEVTVINLQEVVPWKYPPRYEYMYGEWLREQFENGVFAEPTVDPDLAILVAQLMRNSINLFGPKAEEVFEPVPMDDIRKAMKESLPGLMASVKGDERNVILTLARMWLTASTGEFSSKDLAAAWAMPQLPEEQAALLDVARKAYLGEVVDRWEGRETEVASLMNSLKRNIDGCLKW